VLYVSYTRNRDANSFLSKKHRATNTNCLDESHAGCVWRWQNSINFFSEKSLCRLVAGFKKILLMIEHAESGACGVQLAKLQCFLCECFDLVVQIR
jgi:hypothetical protein